MKSGRLLLKKCFRDIFKNLKQFIAIIFIIATSVTLFIGLEANYKEFNRRIDTVFSASNMGDIYLTSMPDIQNGKDQDLLKIEEILKDKGSYEKRISIPSFKFNDSRLTGLFYDKMPEISKPYDVTKDSTSNDDNFFYIDETVLKIQENFGRHYKIGDTINVSFSETQLESLLTMILGEELETVNETCKAIVKNAISNTTLRDYLLLAIDRGDSSMLSKSLPSILTDLLLNPETDNISFNFKITGTMKHAENVENGSFSTSSFVMSSRLFQKTLLSRIESNLDINFINSALVTLSMNGMDNVSYNRADKYLNDKNNQKTLESTLSLMFKEYKRELETEEGIESLNNLYDQIVIKVNNSSDVDEILNSIKEYFLSKEKNNLILAQTKENLSSTMTIMNDLNQSQMLALTFPLIFFLVAILVVLTTITQLLLKERTQIGTLKALGYSKFGILTYYSGMMNIISLIGVILGFIIGPLLLPYVLNIKYDLLYCLPSIGYSFPFLAGFLVLIIVIFLVTLLTYILIRHELSLTPVESMRPASPHFKMKNKKSFIKSTSLMMALRNIKVYLNKSVMVIVGIMGCTGLLICGFGIEDVLDYGINRDLTNFVNGDLNLTYSLNTPLSYNKDQLLKFDNIKEVNEYGYGISEILLDNPVSSTYYYVSKESSLFKYDDGHEWKEGEIGIADAILEKTGKKVGDEIDFKVNSTTYHAKIGFSFYAFSCKGIYIYQGDANFKGLPQNANAATVLLKDVSKASETSKKILSDENLKVETIMTREETSAKIEGYVSSIKMMTNTIKIFAIVLAVIVLVNLAILNFNQRIREIATLRVLGFNLIEIAKSLIYEIMILTLIGCFFGIFLGFPLEFMTLYANRTELVSFYYIVYPMSYVISILISLITAFLVNLYISKRVNKVPMAESLKSVE